MLSACPSRPMDARARAAAAERRPGPSAAAAPPPPLLLDAGVDSRASSADETLPATASPVRAGGRDVGVSASSVSDGSTGGRESPTPCGESSNRGCCARHAAAAQPRGAPGRRPRATAAMPWTRPALALPVGAPSAADRRRRRPQREVAWRGGPLAPSPGGDAPPHLDLRVRRLRVGDAEGEAEEAACELIHGDGACHRLHDLARRVEELRDVVCAHADGRWPPRAERLEHCLWRLSGSSGLGGRALSERLHDERVPHALRDVPLALHEDVDGARRVAQGLGQAVDKDLLPEGCRQERCKPC